MREGHMYGMFLSGVSKSVMQMTLERSSDNFFLAVPERTAAARARLFFVG